MSSSDLAAAHLELPPLRRPPAVSGAVGEDGRWSPPSWKRAAAPALEAPPDVEAVAFARGLEAGRGEGEKRAEADLHPVVQALQRAAERIEHVEALFERDRAQTITVLALAVARQILQREIAASPDVVTGLVTRALELVPREAPVEVRLHPQDLALVEAAGIRAGSAARDAARPVVRWVADPALERGDCMVESEARLVDGRVDVALRQLAEKLTHESA